MVSSDMTISRVFFHPPRFRPRSPGPIGTERTCATPRAAVLVRDRCHAHGSTVSYGLLLVTTSLGPKQASTPSAPAHVSGRAGRAPGDRLRRRCAAGPESARWLRLPSKRCGMLSNARPPCSPWSWVWPIRAGTPSQSLSNGTTSASLSHRPSHLSPSQMDKLERWTMPPRGWGATLSTVRSRTPSRSSRE